MLLSSRFRQASYVVVLGLLFGPPPPLHASTAARVAPGIHPNFGAGGFAASKILQEFHLPSSPNDLLQFRLEYSLKQKLGNTLPLNLKANDTYPTVYNGQLPDEPFHVGAAKARTLSPKVSRFRQNLPCIRKVIPYTSLIMRGLLMLSYFHRKQSLGPTESHYSMIVVSDERFG